ncbi:protoheme IX farnesyltransferase [Gracilibacillus halophilus YIM-C55.5]|uniref:Protoheme IX farnesyltransferase n=1 Tax=Gracilibacillus halophilus YIM-C55.5 TaxID=1308866 RepID=N4WVE4_9BACI|nr:heme o synthase [Gracilibacillus halophilus]ENH98360.1 protoheme IX farnesyltransferase [Gracilibacillus halophilus YIM-C55.5]
MDKMQLSSEKPLMATKTKSTDWNWQELKSLLKIGIIQSNTMTAFAGFWLALFYTGASFATHWHIFLVVIIGTAFVIAGGCVLNNYYDRDIDQVMQRTKTRPSVTGSISLSHILMIGMTLTVVGLLILSLASWQAAVVGAIGWFSYVILYTMWSKRRYTINTAIGSLSGAIPPLIGWAAVDPHLHPVAWLLFFLVFIWQTPHFLAIAIKKKEEYQLANIPMLPVVYGDAITKRQMLIYIACLLPLPLYFISLGYFFLIVVTMLNIGWLVLAVKGLFTDQHKQWANRMFIYSLFYLTSVFVLMIIVTLPEVMVFR